MSTSGWWFSASASSATRPTNAIASAKLGKTNSRMSASSTTAQPSGTSASIGRMVTSRLELLLDEDVGRRLDLPDELVRLYGGGLSLARPRLFANFVATVDGVVAIPGLPRANRVISRDSEPDRFVMGLLRAAADAVLIGSGTLAALPRGS